MLKTKVVQNFQDFFYGLMLELETIKNIILGHSESIRTRGILRTGALHKLWPFQNGMFSITEIRKNRKNQEKTEIFK